MKYAKSVLKICISAGGYYDRFLETNQKWNQGQEN